MGFFHLSSFALQARRQNFHGGVTVSKDAIKTTIYGHPEFVAFIGSMTALYADWQQHSANTLKALQVGCHPKAVIKALADDLLGHYVGKPLIDAYDVYPASVCHLQIGLD